MVLLNTVFGLVVFILLMIILKEIKVVDYGKKKDKKDFKLYFHVFIGRNLYGVKTVFYNSERES